MTAPALADVRRELRALADPRHAAIAQRFFKTGPGDYGEGDRFLGVRVPQLRGLARKYRALSRRAALQLLRSPWHEERLLALLLLIEHCRRADKAARKAICRAYLAHARYVNNWNLVDASAEVLLGAQVDPAKLGALEKLARSRFLWKRRIAIMATFYWIKRGVHHPALRIAERMLDDPHDLIHKAVGWMLREVGKRNRMREEAFLRTHYRRMPRTMLRYAIERLPERRRRAYLRGTIG